ncbi:MAG: acetyl-CoA C-acetyltransferase [Anaerolineae bacterium]|jgi:acetyl-CoA C-acetyltransferase
MRENGRIPVIVAATRTAIGSFGGTLSKLSASDLGAVAIKGVVERAGIDPGAVNEVLMGCVVPAGQGQAPARQAAIKAGIPATVGAVTVNKVCGSGLETVMLAASMVKAGDGDLYVTGGMENMNLAPYLLQQGRTGYRLGHGELLDAVVHDGLWCPFEDQHMGLAAEWVAQEYEISRQEQDQFALGSQEKAVAAIEAGRFKDEIVPLTVPQRKGDPITFDTDECPRKGLALENLSRLKPVFKKDGTVTPGNASAITDGAAAVLVMSLALAEDSGLEPLARIEGYVYAAVEPLKIFTAPIFALRKLLKKTGTTLADYDLIELNEAFAAQCLADGKALAGEGWDWDKVNVNGGASALGHPIGCSGARVLVTLLHALRQRGLKRGIAALCLGGGEAVAMSVERPG